MRKRLKQLRSVELGLPMCKMADKLGITRGSYRRIEKGISEGKPSFWARLQDVFNIPDEEIFLYMKDEQNGEKTGENIRG